MSNSKLNIRHLDITDLQRIERFRRAGYGGSVSDALNRASVYAILSSQIDLKPSVRGYGRPSLADQTTFLGTGSKYSQRTESSRGKMGG